MEVDPNILNPLTRELLANSIRALVFGSQSGPANVDHIAMLAVAVDSSLYAQQHMQGKPRFGNRHELLSFATKQVVVDGIVLEFGVHTGTTINHISSCLPDHKIFGFDSFRGLPEDWTDGMKKGHFAVEQVPTVRNNVDLVVGWFDDTLPEFVTSHKDAVSLLHIDCDLYSSTRTVFQFLNERIVPGTIVVFDEYFNYTRWRDHEYKAFQEFCASNNVKYEYIGLVPSFEQVAVRITHR